MRYYNADGGEAEMCGNGARCFARFANRLAGSTSGLRFETMAGVIRADFEGGLVKIAMSQPTDLSLNHELSVALENLTVHFVNTGVPHAVVIVDDLENVAIERLGPAIRYHGHFAPKGTNVNFVKVLHNDEIAIRTYERGVEGETLACGTGVVASALIFDALSGAGSPVKVKVMGGDTLEVSFEKENAASSSRARNVTLTGPADFVFDGEIEL
jgi:diaminopimelate epimerase